MTGIVFKAFVATLGSVFLLSATSLPAEGSKPVGNHFMILIDGSGSNVRGSDRRTAFYAMLRDTVTTALFEKGFGPAVRPYDSQRDLLSICDFGIVDGRRVKKSAARNALRRYSFKKDFIHVRAKRERDWTAEKFRSEITPKTWYQIQVLNWAIPLAVMSLRPEDDFLVENTYVLLVTDGERYEDDYADEESQAFRYGDSRSPRWAREKSVAFKRNYSRSGGGDSAQPTVWSTSVSATDGGSEIFAELYSLKSTSRERLRKSLEKGDRFLAVQPEWRQRGEQTVLQLKAEYTEQFHSLAEKVKIEDQSLEFTRGLDLVEAQSHGGSGFQATMPVLDPCVKRAVDYRFSVTVSTADALLGHLAYTRDINASLGKLRAPFCQSGLAPFFSGLRIFAFGCLVVLCSVGGLKLMQGRRMLPLAVQPRHHLSDIAMTRLGSTETDDEPIYSTILPSPGREAFRIIPKPRFVQQLMLPNSRMVIELQNGGSSGTGDISDYLTIPNEMVLPLSPGDDRLIAKWQRLSGKAIRVLISVCKDNQPVSRMSILFPPSKDV